MDASSINSLEDNLKKLLENYHELKVEVLALENGKQALEKEIEVLNEKLKSFQNQDKITKIVQSVADDGERPKESVTELKLKINEYIKEIDKCILHLSE